jgi:hypothetical protein
MEMADHDPSAAKRLGIPKKVAHEYVQADKGKHFKKAVRKGKKREQRASSHSENY